MKPQDVQRKYLTAYLPSTQASSNGAVCDEQIRQQTMSVANAAGLGEASGKLEGTTASLRSETVGRSRRYKSRQESRWHTKRLQANERLNESILILSAATSSSAQEQHLTLRTMIAAAEQKAVLQLRYARFCSLHVARRCRNANRDRASVAPPVLRARLDRTLGGGQRTG